MNVWVKPVDAPFDEARPMTTGDRPVPGHFWSMDSEYLLYVQDKGGNENFHVYAVDHSGRVRLAVRQTADGGTETLKVVDGEPGEVLYSCNWRETCGPMRFHADNQRVYFQSNKGAAGEFETWKVALEPIDGEGGGQTLWVKKIPPRVVVKSETRLPPQMGGAQVTSELASLHE